MHTSGGAYQQHLDRRTGSLVVGKDADLLILDRDIFAIPEGEIHDARPLLTMVRGRALHRDQGFAG